MVALYIIAAILIFGFLIIIHEFGHYIFARIFKVGIKEFSMGMGPKILSRKSEKTGVLWSWRLLPIGGYVSMVGEDDDTDSPDAFNKKHPLKRIVILLAGGMNNIIVGIILMAVLIILTVNSLGSTTVAKFIYAEDSASALSEESGLMTGDKIIKVGKVGVHTANDLMYEIMHQGSEPVNITVIRDGSRTVIENVNFPTFTESGAVFGENDFIVYAEQPSFGTVIKHTFFRSLSTVKMVYDSFIDLITGKYGIEAMSGPVGLTEVVVDTAKTGNFLNILYLMSLVAINLGVVNLFPLPALDGGRILFAVFELIAGKRLNPKIEGYIHTAGLILLLALMAFITVKDILKLF